MNVSKTSLEYAHFTTWRGLFICTKFE